MKRTEMKTSLKIRSARILPDKLKQLKTHLKEPYFLSGRAVSLKFIFLSNFLLIEMKSANHRNKEEDSYMRQLKLRFILSRNTYFAKLRFFLTLLSI